MAAVAGLGVAALGTFLLGVWLASRAPVAAALCPTQLELLTRSGDMETWPCGPTPDGGCWCAPKGEKGMEA